MTYTTANTIDLADLTVDASIAPYDSALFTNFHVRVTSGDETELYPITSYTIVGDVGTLVFPDSTISCSFKGDKKYIVKVFHADNIDLDASGVALTQIGKSRVNKITAITEISF